MGLDMYLNAKRCLSEYNEIDAPVKTAVNEAVGGVFKGKIHEIKAEVAYWRKANAIHAWFVENVQDGEDNCGEYWVSKDKLKELLDTVKKVLDNNSLAQELLPPKSGFFFGETEIDEWYIQQLEYTNDTISELLEIDDKEGWDFYYQSSW